MGEAYSIPRPAALVEVWPPDDTEESVMGTDLHQLTIMNLHWGMTEVVTALTALGQAASWQALNQTVVNGFERLNGSRYKTLPDVFVYGQPIDPRRGSVEISVDGPPLLIIEALSELTYASDLNMHAGKGYKLRACGGTRISGGRSHRRDLAEAGARLAPGGQGIPALATRHRRPMVE